jgi:dienelactone hydrolase
MRLRFVGAEDYADMRSRGRPWLSPLLLALSAALAVPNRAADAQVPLPSDLHIEAASADTADARFLGAWGNGAWGGVTPAALVVERIAPDGAADVIYAVGDSPQAGIQAQWLRLRGTIRHGTLTLPRPNGSAEYRLTDGGELRGMFQYRSGAHSHVWLSRIPGTPADIVATEALPITPLWRDIRITEHSRFGRTAGETIQLQATLYRTTLPGRQPLIVFNHGGGDKDRPGVPTVFRAEDIARVFLARGYNVIVPMRKGRGLSGGPDVEDSDTTPHIQVESAVEDLDAVVDHMAAQPWVDPARIIVAGWSRGGFLSLIYAARFPRKVAGVINFAGCWTPELGGTNAAEFNRTQMAEAGRTVTVPTLWLYADNDHYWSLPSMQKIFAAFQASGGRGSLAEFTGIPNDGHVLPLWISKWRSTVAGYLEQLERR